MSGPVRPPLTTKLDNNSSENRPVNTIAFANTDFSLTNSGTKTTVALSGGGGGTIGGSIADTQVAFGSAADTIEGEAAFTYDKTINQLKLTGFGDDQGEFLIERSSGNSQTISIRNDSSTSPIIRVNSAGTNAKYMQFMNTISTASTSGGSSGFIFYHQVSGNSGSLLEFLRMKTDDSSTYEVVFNEDSKDQDFRVESNAYSDMFFIDGGLNKAHFGTGGIDNALGLVQINVGNSTQNALTLSSTDADAASAPTVEFYRNSASPAAGDQLGIIEFSGKNSSASKLLYASINAQIDSTTSAFSSMQFEVFQSGSSRTNFRIRNSEVVVNEDSIDCNFRVEGVGTQNLISADAALNTVGIGGVAQSDSTVTIYDTNNQDVLLRLETDDNSANKSPALEFYKNSTADISDYIMAIDTFGLDSGPNKSQYSRIATYIEDETAGTENAVIIFQVAEAGSLRSNIVMGSTLVTVNGSSRNVDFRVLADDGSKNIYSDAGINAVGIQEQPTTGLADNNPALQVNGSMSAKAPIIVTASATSITLTNAQMSGHVLWFGSGSTITVNLPDGVQGDHIKVIMPSGDIDFQPQPSGQINGATAGSSINRNSAQNEILELICVSANKWYLNNP